MDSLFPSKLLRHRLDLAGGEDRAVLAGKSGQHICLSLYGKVFDGYDHGASALFGGFVANNMVSIYDYQEAVYFDYQL